LKYWTGTEYLGLGVAAYSFLRDGKSQRFGNTRNLDEYRLRVSAGTRPVAQQEILTNEDEHEEYIMLRLRLAKGISFADYTAHFGHEFTDKFADAIRICGEAGLIRQTQQGITPTVKGFDLQNTLIGEFLKSIQ